MKKALSILCASIISFSGSNMYVLAEGNDIPADNPVIPEYLYTDYIFSDISIDSSRNTTGTSKVDGDSSLVNQIVIHQYLQKKNGSNWNTIDSWSHTTYELLIDVTEKLDTKTVFMKKIIIIYAFV